MTEKEAWLELANGIETHKEPYHTHTGLCYRISAQLDGRISKVQQTVMQRRLKIFEPSPGAVWWWWPRENTPETRTLRATACCFLAAMAETDA